LLANLGEKIGFLKFYSGILKKMESSLHLEEWTWSMDHLWRDLAPAEVMEDIDAVHFLLLKTIWPGNKPRLEAVFKGALQTWSDYCSHFESASCYRDAKFMVSSHIEPWMSSRERFKIAAEKNKWSNRNAELLLEYTRKLNEMIDIVRDELHPTYRQDDGYFLIYDSLGYRNNMTPVIFRP